METKLCKANDSVLERMVLQYSRQIAMDKQWLGLLDLALLSKGRKKNIMVCYFDDSFQGLPSSRSLLEMLHHPTGGRLGSPAEVHAPLDSIDTWVFVACSADYSRKAVSQLNHWMPAWPKAQIGEHWDALVQHGKNKMDKKVKSLQARISGVDSDDSEAEGIKASLEETLEKQERRRHFYEMMFLAELFPVEVPADGNCMLWTFHALAQGPTVRTSLSTHEKVTELRAAAWRQSELYEGMIWNHPVAHRNLCKV